MELGYLYILHTVYIYIEINTRQIHANVRTFTYVLKISNGLIFRKQLFSDSINFYTTAMEPIHFDSLVLDTDIAGLTLSSLQ
jgi:hypothetical protein